MKRLLYFLILMLIPSVIYAYTVGTGSNAVPANWAPYAVDPGAPDSGVTSTAHVTLKNLVTDIGTTKKQTIIFPHTASGTTTQYTISTALDLSSYSNITFQIENGAQFRVSDGVSGVTLPSPSNIKAQPNQQIMSGTSLYFAKPGTFHPGWYEGAPDGLTDNTTAINAAILAANKAGGGDVELISGASYVALSMAMKSNVRLLANGATINKNAGAAATRIVDLSGATTTTLTLLTGGVSSGATNINVTDSSIFTVGDYVALYDDTYAYGTSGRNLELNRIAAIPSGATITLANYVISTYAVASTASLVKLNPITNASVEGGIWDVVSGQNGGGIFGTYCYNCIVKDVLVKNPNDYPGVGFQQSAYSRIENCTIRDGQNLSTSGYGFQAGEASHNIDFVNCNTEHVRENMITTGSKFINVRGGNVVASYDSGWNTHGSGVRNCTIESVTIISSLTYGIAVGGSAHNAGDSGINILNNRIYNSGSHAISIAAPSVGSSDNSSINVIGNRIWNFGTVVANSLGIGVGYSDDVQIANNHINGNNNAKAARGIYIVESVDSNLSGNHIYNLASGYGINWVNCNQLTVSNNHLHDIGGYNLYAQGTTNAYINVIGNQMDDSTNINTIGSGITEYWTNNDYGASGRDEISGKTQAGPGEYITHNLGTTPSVVIVSGTSAYEMVSGTTITSTQIGIWISKHDGSSGSTQWINWTVKR